MTFIKKFFMGIAIGSGAILPGISSGVLCVIFGIYETLLTSILHFFRDIRKNFEFLFPIVLGTFIGIFIFSNLLSLFLNFFPLQSQSLFIGLILGCIPSLLHNVNKQYSFKVQYILFLLFTFSIGLFSVFLENNFSFVITANYNFYFLIFCGFAMSVGIVVPGVSSTVILMLLGVYSSYLSSISYFYIPFLFPMGIGLLLGCFIFMKITNYLLKNYYPQTFFSIIGFTLGSIFVLMPKTSSVFDFFIVFLCILLGFSISLTNFT